MMNEPSWSSTDTPAPTSGSSLSARRYLAVMFPNLSTDRVRRLMRAGRLKSTLSPGQPLAILIKDRGALRLAALDEGAAARGLKPGMGLADARAMHPDLAVADADPAADAALLQGLVDWARRYTPLVAPDAPDGLVLDITGSAHLFGGEHALLRDLAERLRLQGFFIRGAIAGTPEAAAALARSRAGAIVPSGGEREALRDLPLAALRIDAGILAGLERLGFRRIEDLMLRPRAPLAARFGAALLDRLDAALGRTRSAIGAGLEAPPYVVERRFFEPILTQNAVMGVLAHLGGELARLLLQHGEGARALELALFRVDGAVRRVTVGLARPTRDPDRFVPLFRERFAAAGEEIDLGYGFDLVRLAALAVARLDAAAPRLDGAAASGDVTRLIDQLDARLGLKRVRRLDPQDKHWPDEAARLAPAGEAPGAAAGWLSSPERPIRLFERPEPIEAIDTVPDGPPVRFRWRRVLHELLAYEGPERIAPAWWDREGLTRDYFRAEDRQGRRFWLFREGLYGREVEHPRWFLHGLFA